MPRALAGNSGVKGNVLISKLYSEHHEGNKNMGFDIEVSNNVLYLKQILCHFILLKVIVEFYEVGFCGKIMNN